MKKCETEGKNSFAVTPPMGWNSYDYFDTAVTEDDIKAAADYMSANLKKHGWEYIVVDIEWYAVGAGSRRYMYQYIPFADVMMDEYSRLIPDEVRFPSSKGGAGFKALADYVHEKGLRFGIHIMRGIPRQAAHTHTAILGSDTNASDLADPSNICQWNPDMYGVRVDDKNIEAAQAYYDSIFKLYAQWGVDFVKCDDICRMDMPSAKKEIELLHNAIMKSGRAIVLSLSPGPAIVEEAWHYEKYANMWRITDDFWDNWDLLKAMFFRCERWQDHVSAGCWPDCDMLPLGQLGKGFGHEWKCNFTKAEQRTMMTLWCIFRSPLMLGGNLTGYDEDTLKLLTNDNVLALLNNDYKAVQIERDDDHAIWMTRDAADNNKIYLAYFNLKDEKSSCTLDISECTDLWTGERYTGDGKVSVEAEPHGCVLVSC